MFLNLNNSNHGISGHLNTLNNKIVMDYFIFIFHTANC